MVKLKGQREKTEKKSSSKKGKKRKYLIKFKYYQNGAKNGFS